MALFTDSVRGMGGHHRRENRFYFDDSQFNRIRRDHFVVCHFISRQYEWNVWPGSSVWLPEWLRNCLFFSRNRAASIGFRTRNRELPLVFLGTWKSGAGNISLILPVLVYYNFISAYFAWFLFYLPEQSFMDFRREFLLFQYKRCLDEDSGRKPGSTDRRFFRHAASGRVADFAKTEYLLVALFYHFRRIHSADSLVPDLLNAYQSYLL